jgi:hypothetical protein
VDTARRFPVISAQVILVPWPIPVCGSAFPRVTQRPPKTEHKTKPGWPLRQEIPKPDYSAVRALIEQGQRAIADERERRVLRELCP